MFTLLYGLWKWIFRKDEYFILILGLDNAGKTTYLEQTKTRFTKNYKALPPNKVTATVGLNIGKVDTLGVRLNFWDLGGQEELQSLWDKYYAECHAIIYVIDASDRSRLAESKAAFDQMIKSEHLIGVPLLILANKQDIPDCMGVREVKPVFADSGDLIGRRDCLVMPICALNGEGVEESIQWLTDCVLRNSTIRPPKEDKE
ncbi:unnamed protein product [Darwinula stevensoni]|uniref:ADP-ribosylation factor-related protein 1 n=1 Tax=Darwinula stevensoni TaxID=69355 RepID=A0A7R9FQ47_9CRUS|nr:unnamed protein product [Darwinula stevensoni]CAG0899065.1 unnamed protein product [Darwinula stevensoni]